VILLDTHVLIWLDTDDRRLGRKTRSLIDQHWGSGAVHVSAISYWEVGLLCERGRFKPAKPLGAWRNQWATAGLTELPLDGGIAVRALELAGISPDPADRFIAATAIANGATLVTADSLLLEWRHTLARHDAQT
jgi:PIN domain nuclease of toxin-antitoxin system